MMEKLRVKAEEIIKECVFVMQDKTCTNYMVIEIILREFKEIMEHIVSDDKVIVLNKKRDLWSTRTIIDSANYDDNKLLFIKVFEFEKLCKQLDHNFLIVKYDY